MKNKIFFVLFILIIFFSFIFFINFKITGNYLNEPIFVHEGGNIYWVSPNGSSSWNNCKSEIPLNGALACNISTANNNAVAGDIIYLRGGVYRDEVFISPKNSGSASLPIVFSAYANERVVLNNQKILDGKQENGIGWMPINNTEIYFKNSEQVYEGNYSTKFLVTNPFEGIKSFNFSLDCGPINEMYYLSFWVYSNQSFINVYIEKGNGGGPAINRTFQIAPNRWNFVDHYIMRSDDAGAGQFICGNNSYLMLRAPFDIENNAVYYIDDVKIHRYPQPAIKLMRKDHIKIFGIIFENVFRGFEISDGSDYNEIAFCNFTDMNVFNANIIFDNIEGLPSTHNWIHNNFFYKSGFVLRDNLNDATICNDIQTMLRIGSEYKYNYSSGSWDYEHYDKSSYNLIENNTFFHAAHDLLTVNTPFNVIRFNRFHSEGWMKNLDGPCISSAGGYNNPSYFGGRNVGIGIGPNLIENNKIGPAGIPPDDDGANGIENPSDSNIVRYNDFFGNPTAGFYFRAIQGGYPDLKPDNNKIYSNTYYGNGFSEQINSGLQGGVFVYCYSFVPYGNIIKNNIFFNNSVSIKGLNECPNGYYSINNLEEDPLFINSDISDPFDLFLPDFRLNFSSPAIDSALSLTNVSVLDSGSGTILFVDDAGYFQDGSWGPEGLVQADWIAIRNRTNVAKIVSINYSENKIILDKAIERTNGDPIWLYKDSSGRIVFYGEAPDIGAHEFVKCVDKDLDGLEDYDADSCPTGKDKCVQANVNDWTSYYPIVNAENYNLSFVSNGTYLDITNFSLTKTNYAQLFFKANLKLVDLDEEGCFKKLNLTNIVKIYDKKIIIDSNYSEFNKPAIIIFENVSYEKIKILKNGEECSNNICKNLSYNKTLGIVSFEVDSFSIYEVVEDVVSNSGGAPLNSGENSNQGSGGSGGSSSVNTASQKSNISRQNSFSKIDNYSNSENLSKDVSANNRILNNFYTEKDKLTHKETKQFKHNYFKIFILLFLLIVLFLIIVFVLFKKKKK